MSTPRPASGSRPPGWQQEHARRYVESGGKDGHIWEGVTTLLLTTPGRRSGQARTTPLIYGRDGDRYVVVASRGGDDRSPAWLLNLQDDPEVEVAFKGAARQRMRARVATPPERARLWPLVVADHRNYAAYQAKTSRQIPLVLLEPVA